MRKRERLEIIRDVLTAIRDKGNSVKPTHILYKSNLSSGMLKGYLSELIDKQFIVENSDRNENRRYALTEKGFSFLRDYEAMRSFLVSYGLESDDQ